MNTHKANEWEPRRANDQHSTELASRILDALKTLDADADLIETRRRGILGALQLQGLTIPDELAAPETASIYASLGVEMKFAAGAANGTYVTTGLHMQRIDAEHAGFQAPRTGRISTYPFVPCTRICCPSRISRVAYSTPTTAGKPYSRAITAPWVIRPPTSVTRPLMATNRGVQLGSV
jgi:hypothetical protein